MSILVYPAIFGAAVVIGYLLYPLPWSLLKRRHYAEGGIIPKPMNPGDVPIFLSGGRAWMRKPNGEWVEINDDHPNQDLINRINR